jgi:glutamine synthetase
LPIPIPPLSVSSSTKIQGERLPKTLGQATSRFMNDLSIAREILGDDFVTHYGGIRLHELRQFEEAITDWELERYMELT